MPGMHVVLVLPDVDVFQKSNYTSARGPATLEDRGRERSLPIGALENMPKILSLIDGPGIARTGEGYLLPQNRPFLSHSHAGKKRPPTRGASEKVATLGSDTQIVVKTKNHQ
jgi:hypothetical protein